MAPPGAQQQQQQGGGDNSMAPIWVSILIFFTLIVIWKTSHQFIVSAVFSLLILQAKLVNVILDSAPLEQTIYLMQTVDPSAVTWTVMVGVMGEVGKYYAYPMAVIMGVMAYMLYKSDVTIRFKKRHTMDTLRRQEQANWSAITPVIDLNLSKVDVSKGPWAMALTPFEFAKQHDLLKKSDTIQDKPVPGQDMTAGIRKGDAKRLFTLQLGPAFSGFHQMPLYAQALAACFMARINKDRDTPAHILDVINKTCLDKHPDYTVALPTLKKYEGTALVQKIASQHAYLLTAMAGLLAEARNDGVIQSAEFLWLKPVDRRLWFMLNSVGRQTPFVEVGGPFAHWKAERALKRRSLAPMVDEAVKALEIAVREVKLKPEALLELKP